MSINNRPVDPERDGFEWANGLENVDTVHLVNELLRRGWVAGHRTRNSKRQTVLRAPLSKVEGS